MLFNLVKKFSAKRKIKNIRRVVDNIKNGYRHDAIEDIAYILDEENYEDYILPNWLYIYGFLISSLIAVSVFFSFKTASYCLLVLLVILAIIETFASIVLRASFIVFLDEMVSFFRHLKLVSNLKTISNMKIKSTDDKVTKLLKLYYPQNMWKIESIFKSDIFEDLNRKYYDGKSERIERINLYVFLTETESIDYHLLVAKHLKQYQRDLDKLKNIMVFAEQDFHSINEGIFNEYFVSFYDKYKEKLDLPSRNLNTTEYALEMKDRDEKSLQFKYEYKPDYSKPENRR